MPAGTETTAAATALNPLRVVLCDDVPELRELTRYGLEQDDRLRVAGEAGSAEECFDAVREHRPDVVLLDLSLPGMDGLEAIPRLREIDPGLAIVIFSGFEAARMESVALEQGANAYVEKGTPLAEIRATLLQTAGAPVPRAAPRPSGSATPSVPAAQAAPPAPVARSREPQGESRFKLLATRVPVGIFETDTDGRCTFVNLRWSEIAGLDWDQALGVGWLDAVHPDDRERVDELWQAAVAVGHPFAHEFRFRAPAGRVSWVTTEAVPLADEDGEPIGYLGTIVDVTDRREAEGRAADALAELELHAIELERSNSDLEQFAYVASHDLSEPLHVTGGFVELLEQHYSDALDADGRRFVANALNGVRRMQSLIDDLLAYSRVGRAELVRIEVDSAAIVAEVVERLESQRASAAAEIEVGELPRLSAEPRMLERVFQNLLSNALKFAGPEPRVKVAAERDDDAWRFSVADHGPGIEPDQVERAFEMFQRMHGREIPGTGIGLAICRRIVERHGGRITYAPAAGGGSVFSFTIPD